MFLYGLIPDFFLVWADPNKPTARSDVDAMGKAIFAWPAYIKAAMRENIAQIIPSGLCSKYCADLFKCAFFSTPCPGLVHRCYASVDV